MWGFADKDFCTILFELGSFFQDLCFRTLRKSDLEKLEGRILLILCKLEKYFPPAFFDVMVHLAVHLPREAILGGPVQYRWMHPLKSNSLHPLIIVCRVFFLSKLYCVCSHTPNSFFLEGFLEH